MIFSVKPFYDLIKGFSFLYVFNDCFIEKKMVVGLVIASENRGTTGGGNLKTTSAGKNASLHHTNATVE